MAFHRRDLFVSHICCENVIKGIKLQMLNIPYHTIITALQHLGHTCPEAQSKSDGMLHGSAVDH